MQKQLFKKTHFLYSSYLGAMKSRFCFSSRVNKAELSTPVRLLNRRIVANANNS